MRHRCARYPSIKSLLSQIMNRCLVSSINSRRAEATWRLSVVSVLKRYNYPFCYVQALTQIPEQQAASVKQAVKRGLTQRLRERVGMGDSDSDTESSDDEKTLENLRKKRGGRRGFMKGNKNKDLEADAEDQDNIKDDGTNSYESQNDVGRTANGDNHNEKFHGAFASDFLEVEVVNVGETDKKKNEESKKSKFQLPKVPAGMTSMSMLEQSMPADAVLAKSGAAEVGNCSFSKSRLSDFK